MPCTEKPLPENYTHVQQAEEQPLNQFITFLGVRIKNILYPVGEAYLNSPQKRAMDIIGSIALLPLASLSIAGAGLVIKLKDGGPIFFITNAVGKGGENFSMFKLRSMATLDKQNEEVTDVERFWTKKNDPRVTKVGKFIRQWSIDELPQLINILRGEMSLVGNRPMIKERIDHLSTVSKLQDLYPRWIETYVMAQPGAFGLAVSRGRHLLDQTEQGHRNRMRYDTFYITHASLGFDIKIVAEGIQAALSRYGAF